ncbi:unnamed protein product [Vitrella brassicaformis CCMP3155]|uniref:CERLI1-like PH domain-containing protein n=2 Tax=Vitrella brassicaformis TaxID=1169539 RepID=A0A0G4FCF2_VITBC|nr:unnamed protein product [Vitrella brassicaformis CCMP3155]|eukprot:CEM10404.1 unnamed protein product [Vitrella brassicaformis CCMP3155]
MATLAFRMACPCLAAVGDAVGSVGCLIAAAAVFALLWTLIANMPHPSECRCIGDLYIKAGWHKHYPFNMVVEVHHGEQYPTKGSHFLLFRCGRNSERTTADPKCQWHQRLKFHVRQCDKKLKIFFMTAGTIKNTEVPSLELDIDDDLCEQNFPKQRAYQFKGKDNRNAGKAKLSFIKIEGEIPSEATPLMQQAMLRAQIDAGESDEPLNLDLEKMTETDKLRLCARCITGPLEKMAAFGSWRPVFVKAQEAKAAKWELAYWDSQESCRQGQEKLGSIPFIAVSKVVVDPSDRHSFFIQYHEKSGNQVVVRDWCLKRVDRDRDLWVDGLYEFIDTYRNVRDKLKEEKKEEKAQKKLQKKAKKKKKGSAAAAAASAADESAPGETEGPATEGLLD